MTLYSTGATSIPHPQTMRASVLAAPRSLTIVEKMLSEPKGNEVRVRLEGCGVCASNLPLWEGRPWFNYPLAPGTGGHEAWGVIDCIGSDVTELKVGDRVALLSNNAYAEYDFCSKDHAVKLPSQLDDKPFPGEALGCAVNIYKRSNIRAGQTVAIVGIGFLGALLTNLCMQSGARVIAITRRPFALDIARQFGAAEIIQMDTLQRVVEVVQELTQGAGCERVIEAVGKQATIDLAAELTKERGRLIIAGYHQDGLRQVNMQLWNWRGLDVINAHERDPHVYIEGIRETVELVSSGALNPSLLYTHRYKLAQLGEALEATGKRPDGFMKALVMME